MYESRLADRKWNSLMPISLGGNLRHRTTKTYLIALDIMLCILPLLFAKDVFVFFDGTWATEKSNTNIYRMFDRYSGILENNKYKGPFDVTSFIKRNDKNVAIYLRGIGTSSNKLTNVVQGATGYGIEGWVNVAYRFLVDELDPKDELRIFGFSRGSTTARLLSHYLYEYGITSENLVFGRLEKTLLDPQQRSIQGWTPEIRFLGIFDSVKAVYTMENAYRLLKQQIRLKKRSFARNLWEKTVNATRHVVQNLKTATALINDKKLIKYSDELNKNVQKCAHAVAINEYRVLFNYSAVDLANSNFTQQYFIGSHGDIGGSAARALIALEWMLQEGNLFKYFPNVLPTGFNGLSVAAVYTVFDTYTDPGIGNIKTVTKLGKFLLPIFYRPLVQLDNLLHPSVIVLARSLNVPANELAKRDSISSILSLSDIVASS